MAKLRPEEEWARELIANALGARVVQHDDGSAAAMHDLDIEYPGRAPGAVEVTAAADGEAIVLWNLLNGEGRWMVPDLVGGWMASLLPSARAKRIRQELPPLLRLLEASGTTSLHSRRTRTADGRTQLAADLGITHLHQSGTSFPGSIYVTLDLPAERTGGFVAQTGDALSQWVGAFLATAQCQDVRRKLDRSGAIERHAFVILPGFAAAEFAVIDLLMREDAPPPVRAPDLPEEVTHVWAVSTWSTGRGMRWSSSGRWTHFEKRPPAELLAS